MASTKTDPAGKVDRLAASGSAHDLGPALEPVLLEACEGRLSDVRWFRTDWQLGGAATAHATFACSEKDKRGVVVKVPIGPREYRFLEGLNGTDAPTPCIVAHGSELGGYDFAWVVMEQLPGVPLSAQKGKHVFRRVTRLAAGFQKEAGEKWSLEQPPAPPDWEHLLKRAREAIRDNPHIPDASSWAKAVKAAQGALPTLLSIWGRRAINTWCHGDLHPGNCMERPEGSAWGEARDVLFDLAEVHPGHWVEDAVYLERLYWGRPKVLDGAKPVAQLAKARRDVGLDTSDDYALLANVRRVLMAACVPVFLHREGQPAYLEAALGMLDRLLPQVSK